MDELIIGEKKYISSKRAAKVTGYAKDYIGQLCREGRVPARLVGRSWYVLEAAIHDHRFGEQKSEQEADQAPTTISSAWESPRYEASPIETLPSVNRFNQASEGLPVEHSDQGAVSQHLQDSWRAWFDRVAETAPAVQGGAAQVESESEVVEEAQEAVEEPEVRREEERAPAEENVPIRAVYHQPPVELLPRRKLEVLPPRKPLSYEEAPELVMRSNRGLAVMSIQIAGAIIAVTIASAAVLGSGYFDELAISNSQVGMVAGVSLYNR